MWSRFASEINDKNRCLRRAAVGVNELSRLSNHLWDNYFNCMYKNSSFINTGLYLVSLLDFFRHGFIGEQFFFIPTTMISNKTSVHRVLDFLGYTTVSTASCQHKNKQNSIRNSSMTTNPIVESFFRPYTRVFLEDTIARYGVRML